MDYGSVHLLLADDDLDDCQFFQEALTELSITAPLTIVHNGEQLMQILHRDTESLPDILFLDLNMPRKNGFQCLGEIKREKNLQNIPVIIYSTSFQREVVQLLYKYGAHHYIQKPTDFKVLKQVVLHALTIVSENNLAQPAMEDFVLSHK